MADHETTSPLSLSASRCDDAAYHVGSTIDPPWKWSERKGSRCFDHGGGRWGAYCPVIHRQIASTT